MFEIGFSELLIVGVVALIVLGPERLPRAARMLGLFVRRARAHWYTVKAELDRELADEDLRRSLAEAREAGDAVRRDLEATARDIRPDAPASGTDTPPAPGDAQGRDPRDG
jgi:sec-independent protein translocase protein TatB